MPKLVPVCTKFSELAEADNGEEASPPSSPIAPSGSHGVCSMPTLDTSGLAASLVAKHCHRKSKTHSVREHLLVHAFT